MNLGCWCPRWEYFKKEGGSFSVDCFWEKHRKMAFWFGDFSKSYLGQFSSVQFSHSVVSDSLRPHEPHHTRLPITNSRCPPKPMSIELVMPSNQFILYCPLLLLPSIFPGIRVFQMSQLFASGGQSIGVSASTPVLPMNTHDRSPLGWIGWMSLQSKGLSRVFSNTTVQKHQFFMLSFLYSPTLTSLHDHWKNHSLD